MTLLVLGLALRVFIAGVYLPLSGLRDRHRRRSTRGGSGSRASGQPDSTSKATSRLPARVHLRPVAARQRSAARSPRWSARTRPAGWSRFRASSPTSASHGSSSSSAVDGAASSSTEPASRVDAETLGLAAAAIYLFNPGTIFDSAVWGQIDSVGTLVLLATIYALARGWTEMAAIGAVVALLVKFQFAFLIPIVAIVGIRRHLFGRSTDPEHDGQRDPLRALTSLAVGIGTLTILMLPFGMLVYAPLEGGDPRGLLGFLPAADPSRSLIGKLIEAAGTYTGLTENAFNLWRNPWSGLGDTLQRGSDSGVGLVIGSLSLTWQQVGIVLFAAVALLALVACRPPRRRARRAPRGAAPRDRLLRPADARPRALPVPGARARRAARPFGPHLAVDLRRRSRSCSSRTSTGSTPRTGPSRAGSSIPARSGSRCRRASS